MTPVIAFVAVVAAFAAAFAFAIRRGGAALHDVRAALRVVAAQHGWQLDPERSDGFAFRLGGRSEDGIDWTLRGASRGVAAGDTMAPSIVWSTEAGCGASTLVLLVQSRQAYARLRGSLALAAASRLVAAHGFGNVPLQSLYRDGHEHALRDPSLAERFVVVTTDDEIAAAVLGPEVEQALRRWRPEQVSVRIGRDVEVGLESGSLGRDDIVALVALGTAVARGCRARSRRAIA